MGSHLSQCPPCLHRAQAFLMTLEDYLGNRYRITARMPAFAATHQRYVAQSTSGSPESLRAQLLRLCEPAERRRD